MPSATPTTCGIPSAVASVSLNDTPPIIHSPATIPQGTLTGWYARRPPAAFVPATFPCAYAWLPDSPWIGIWETLCGTSMQSPAAQTPAVVVRMPSSTIRPPADPILSPAAPASAVLATFLVQTTARSQLISPPLVVTERTEPSPPKPVSVVGGRQRPRARVDQMRLDAAMAQRGHHFQAER